MTKQVIVCVDDEVTILRSLKAELREAFGDDYLIEIADGGNDALELIEELLEDKYEIPVIISDYIMPDLRGDELLKRVHLISPKTLKVMLTGQATVEAVGNAINHANLYRYIAKPWQTKDMILTVKEAIDSYLQDKLQEHEHRFTQFLEAMPVGVVVLDIKGKPYYVNQKAQELFGKQFIPNNTSQQFSDIYLIYKTGTNEDYPPEDLPMIRALSGENATADNLEIHRDDQIIPIEIRATPIYDNQGNIVYSINTFFDITERKKAEAERQKFIEELFELNCNLELALEAESKLTNAAKRFVPNEFLSFLGYQSIGDVKLGDAVQQEMSILFSDIRSFTTISENMTPEDNFKFINAYLSCMEPAIIENHGFIDKYIGDEIMALFSGAADNAVKAGITMLQLLAQYNQLRTKSGHMPIKIGIGINTGSLMLGIVGGQSRMDSTVISDAVNLASRLENLTKKYETSLLISHHTLACLQNPTHYNIRLIERLKVKGKSQPVAVFEVFDGDPVNIRQAKLDTKMIFEEGLFFYYRQSFQEAGYIFQDILKINPWDKVTQIYLERCQMKNKMVVL